MQVEEDYTEGDRYDWDRNDDSQYCRHGKFIGSWWGPDILCQYCEDGTTDEEWLEILQFNYVKAKTDKFLWEISDEIISILRTFPRMDVALWLRDLKAGTLEFYKEEWVTERARRLQEEEAYALGG